VVYDAKARSLTLTGVLVKEHALPRAVWLHLRNLAFSWHELSALFSEDKANVLLRTTYSITFTEELSATNARLSWRAVWEKDIADGFGNAESV
jgi:hypothetical protein